MNETLSPQWLEEVDSTNNEMIRRRAELDNLSVVAAVCQTAGRGQRNNSWLTHAGENLTFSMFARFSDPRMPRVKATEQFRISVAATLAVSDYLASKGVANAVKWPNDIYVRGRKICGMLIENTLEGPDVSTSIIGIGINVNQKDFPPQLVNPTSMTIVTGESYDLKAELVTLCGMLRDRLLSMGQEQHGDYISRLFRLGVFNEYVDCEDGTRFMARITGVSPSGMLQVETKEGKLKEFAFKEISFVI